MQRGKIGEESCKKRVGLIVLWEAIDHTHRAAVWCSLEQSLIDDAVHQ